MHLVAPVALFIPMKTICVKKSVSVPDKLWAWAEMEADKQGHGMTSRVVADALRSLEKLSRRRKEFAPSPCAPRKKRGGAA